MEYYVSQKGSDINNGGLEKPFLTISKAADVARERNTVKDFLKIRTVHL